MAKSMSHEVTIADEGLHSRNQQLVEGLNRLLTLTNVDEDKKLDVALRMIALAGNVQHDDEVHPRQVSAPERPQELYASERHKAVPDVIAPAKQPSQTPPAEQQAPPEPTPRPKADPSRGSTLIRDIPPIVETVAKTTPAASRTAEEEMSATSIPVPIGHSKARRVVAAAGMSAITVSGLMVAAASEQSNAGEISCNDNGHTAVQVGRGEGPRPGIRDVIRASVDKISPYEDGRQWDALAKRFSKERGYYISADRLAAANQTATYLKDGKSAQLAEYDKEGLSPTIRTVGEYCFTVPEAIVGGQIETDKADTLKLVSTRTNVAIPELRKFNPGLPEDENALLGAGKVVQVAKKLDPTLVLQEVDDRRLEDVADPSTADASKVYARIIDANTTIIAKQGDINTGVRYWPPKQPRQKGNKAQPAETPQIKPAPSDFAKKPEPKAPAKQEQQQKVLSLEERKKLIETLAISPEQKAQLTKFVETLAALPESETKGVRTDVVLAQAIVASNWGTSEAAKHNNFFGLKANKEWKGKTVKVLVAERTPGQDEKTVEYRAYDSMQDAFKDYIAAIKGSTDFAKHGSDSFINHAALANLYGGDTLEFRTEYLFQLLSYEKFGDKKFKDFQVAGGIGNFIIESAHTLDPGIEERISDEALAQKNRGRAFGIVQWQEGRRKLLEVYLDEHGNSLANQGRFIAVELRGSEKSRLAPIMNSGNIEDATVIWCTEYERAGVPHMDKRIDAAHYAMRIHNQAQAHGKLVTQAMKDHKLAELAGWSAPAKAAAPKEQKQATQGPKVVVPEIQGPIVLDPKKYSGVQDPLPGNRSKGAYVDADDNPATGRNGSEARSSQLSYNQRLKIVERELNQAHAKISPEGFGKFKIADVRDEVRAKYGNKGNFVGSKNGLGKPDSPADIKHFVVHFTATNTGANDYDGVKFASTMYNSGGLGVNYHIRNDGETSLLTKDFTYHTKNFGNTVYNGHSYGVEVSASEQSEISAEQYESIVYLATAYLIEQGKVEKGKPVTPAVERIIGHREANAAVGMHHDFPALVMDPVRGMVLKLLVDMGYTK